MFRPLLLCLLLRFEFRIVYRTNMNPRTSANGSHPNGIADAERARQERWTTSYSRSHASCYAMFGQLSTWRRANLHIASSPGRTVQGVSDHDVPSKAK